MVDYFSSIIRSLEVGSLFVVQQFSDVSVTILTILLDLSLSQDMLFQVSILHLKQEGKNKIYLLTFMFIKKFTKT